jgi:hypothetical protein
MPVKILGLNIKREYVRKQRIQSATDVLDCFGTELAGRRQGCSAAGLQFILSRWHA